METVNVLVEYGADVIDGEKEWDQHSPLHLAAANGHMTVVEVLISHNAPVDCRDELQRTPLHRSVKLMPFCAISQYRINSVIAPHIYFRFAIIIVFQSFASEFPRF